MRATLLFSFLLLATAPALGASNVSDVVVFADRAQVTRTQKIRCSGSGQATFEPLPLGLDPRTLRGEASAGAKVIGVTHRELQLDEDQRAEVAKLRKELEALQEELAALQDDERAASDRLANSNSYAPLLQQVLSEQMGTARSDSAAWQSTLDTFVAERRRAAQQRQTLQPKLRKLLRRFELHAAQLAAYGAQSDARARTASVTVECTKSTEVRVDLTYVVPGATWAPEYDLRFVRSGKGRTGKGEAEVTVAAVIRQTTGEAWDNAKIMLSTAKPRLGTDAPRPAPLYVAGHEQEEEKVMVQAAESRRGLRGEGKESQRVADIEDRGQSFVLELPQRATVASDGRPYWFPVKSAKAKAESALVSAPKVSPFVYQVVRFGNPAPHPLVAGRAHIFRGSSYMGDVQLDYTAPGEPMEISLGIDEELRITREELAAKDRSASLLGSTKRMERAYRLSLENRSAGAVRVELRENIPVSKMEEIEVELHEKRTTSGYQLDARRGIVVWNVDLDSGKKRSVDIAFTIKLPESWQVR